MTSYHTASEREKGDEQNLQLILRENHKEFSTYTGWCMIVHMLYVSARISYKLACRSMNKDRIQEEPKKLSTNARLSL